MESWTSRHFDHGGTLEAIQVSLTGIHRLQRGLWLKLYFSIIGFFDKLMYLFYAFKSIILRKGSLFFLYQFSKGVSVQFSRSVISDSLQPHGLQHARPPYPSLTPGVYSNSCPLSRWCHPTISSSVVPFSSHLQSLPASGSFPVSQLFTSGGQSIRV